MPSLKYYDQAAGSYKYLVGGLNQETADARYLMSGFRNVIRNGDMNIAQRGNGPFAPTAYTLDGWKLWGSGGAMTITRGAISGSAATSATIGISGQSGSHFCIFAQPIEDVNTLSGKTATVSFLAKAASGTPSIGVRYLQQFGTGGSTQVVGTYIPVRLTTSWAKYSVQIQFPSTAGKTLGGGNSVDLQIAFSDWATGFQNNGQFDITEIQLEEGALATPFEKIPQQQQLQWCQRYFWRCQPGTVTRPIGCGVAWANSDAIIHVSFPVQMRIAPTMNVSAYAHWHSTSAGGSWVLINNMPSFDTTPFSGRVRINPASNYPSAGVAVLLENESPNGYFDFSAEL